MKAFFKSFGIAILFVISFLLFLLLTFDYGILKEAIASKISRETGHNVTVGTLRPSLPLGVHMSDFRLETPSGQSLRINEMSINASILALFTRSFGFSAEALSKSGGQLEISARLPILDVLRNEVSLPSQAKLRSQAFPLDELVNFTLQYVAEDPATNPLLGPFLSEVGFSGKLDGVIDLDFDRKQPTQSSGEMNIRLLDSTLILSAPSLGLPDQKFTKAHVKATLDNGKLMVSKDSGFVSKDLDLAMSGTLGLSSSFQNSTVNMTIAVKLMETLKEHLGIVLSALGGGAASNGEMTWELTGQLGNPIVKSF